MARAVGWAGMARLRWVVWAVVLMPTGLAIAQPVEQGGEPGRVAVRAGVRPVPEEAAVVDARRSLRDRYNRDYLDVTPAGKRRLAGLMLREAGRAAGDAALWVALSEARDLAVAGGDAETALSAVVELSRRFDVDLGAGRTSVLQSLAGMRLPAVQAAVAARAARALVEARLSADEFESAAKLAQLAEQLGRQSADTALATEVAQLADFCRDVVRRAPAYRAALDKLAETPDDPAANQTAGEFLVMVKQEWGRGLLMLSRGTHAKLKAAASAELSGERGAGLVSAADEWRAWAGRLQGPGRVVALRHALDLYRRAALELSGDELLACQSSAAAVMSSLPTGTELADVRAARAKLGEARWAWWEGLRVGGISVREDAGDLVNSQVILEWNPGLSDGDEVPPAPEGDGVRGEVPAGTTGRLTYVLKLLCTDERGDSTVLSEEGRVTWRSVVRPIRLQGPRNSQIKRANGGRLVAEGAWVEIRLDGVVVAERVWRMPVKRAWWMAG